ncbi:uncharacterized protein [Triticum aestivum]|uniref:uncharacterized protein n=1 Tax=Triticum aestivum TaxID=4565 RepID=UPI00098AB969|nr:uncharacterized protein LOC123050896 [Triticum aestivum]
MARYGPATTFTRPVRKWRKEWVPIAAATATATSAAASSTGTVSVVQGQRQESAKSDNENKANDGEPSSAETEQSNGKANIGDTLMDESQLDKIM